MKKRAPVPLAKAANANQELRLQGALLVEARAPLIIGKDPWSFRWCAANAKDLGFLLSILALPVKELEWLEYSIKKISRFQGVLITDKILGLLERFRFIILQN